MNFSDNSKNIFTVSQISQQIRGCLESRFSSLWIKGELSNFTAHSSGHWYFTLKDAHSQIKAVMFKGANSKLSFRPETGNEILVQGEVSVYLPRGDYQILCRKMEIMGSGLLQQKFEQLKRKLHQEGLFDPSRKRPLPPFPQHIALVTSPTGAAVRDILQILKRRWKGAKVILIPALVQGDQAASSLLNALCLSKKTPAEVVILGRGGGSMEDLWAFNDESLARAIASHPVPVISAVGHEIDFTICDFVADLRAPTPSAAAELVVQNVTDLLENIHHLRKQLIQNLKKELRFLTDKLFTLKKGLVRPDRLIQDSSQRLDDINERFNQSILQVFEKSTERLKHFKQILQSLDPKTVMKRGFSIVSNAKGKLIVDTKSLKIKDSLHIDFLKGHVQASIMKKE